MIRRLVHVVGVVVLTLVTLGAGAAAASSLEGLALTRQAEARERAFSLLVPAGWSMQGGIFRIQAHLAGGPLNAIEAKCDLTLVSPDGLASLRVLPDIVYVHAGVGAGLFPPGSNYQGAMVWPFQDAVQYLEPLFREARPQASAIEFVSVHRLPEEIRLLDEAQAFTNGLLRQIGGEAMATRHDAAGAVIDFEEHGRAMRAVLTTAIVDMPAALTWKNTRSLLFAAPRETFDTWRPAVDVIRASVRFDPQWILRESEGQRTGADFVMKVLDHIRGLDESIRLRQQVNREEIMNDNYLVLTGQEEYRNPHTGEIEVDTDAFRYRWTNAVGDRFYSDREDLDPNVFLHGGNYQRTPVRIHRNE